MDGKSSSKIEHIRRSQRVNIGKPPLRFGESEIVNDFVNQSQQQGTLIAPVIETIDNGSIAFSKMSRTTNSSIVRRKQLELELLAAEERDRFEEELEDRRRKREEESDQKKRTRNLELIKMRLELEKSKLEEISGTGSFRSANRSIESDSCSLRNINSKEIDVAKWVEKSRPSNIPDDDELQTRSFVSEENHSDDDELQHRHFHKEDNLHSNYKPQLNNLKQHKKIENTIPEMQSIANLTEIFTNVLRHVSHDKSETNDKFDRLLTRQVIGKDLPTFSGEPEDWLPFISSYKRTTKQCSFSNEENLIRLQKSLRGKAKEMVSSLMISGENTSEVIEVLELNFGRPELIVMTLIDRARKTPAPREDKPDTFIQFTNAVRNLVITMESLNSTGHMTNPELLNEFVSKLPSFLKYQWGSFIVQGKYEAVSLKQLSDWLKTVSMAATYVNIPTVKSLERRDGVINKNNLSATKKNTVLIAKEEFDHMKCVFCLQDDHFIAECEKFLEKSINDRWDIVSKLKLCFCCLKIGHSTMRCRKKKSCGVEKCKRLHNSTLHSEKIVNQEQAPEKVERVNISNQDENIQVEDSNKVLLRVAPIKLYGPNEIIDTYALFDEGSSCILLDENIANKLGLDGNVKPLCVQWMDETTKYDSFSKNVN